MKEIKSIENDTRLEAIQELLIKFTQFDFSERVPISDKGDHIDAIIVGLNTLGEELSAVELSKNPS
ncbi:MAG: hypothetical protein ACHQF2_09755 [Flavobacteriales bacterium]